VDWALGHAGTAGRFADGDLAAILAHQASANPGASRQAGETASLAQGTSGWARFGSAPPPPTAAGTATPADVVPQAGQVRP
jgi:hypothetical protein